MNSPASMLGSPTATPSSTHCTKCGDGNTQPCHAVWATGTSSIATTTTGGGVAFGAGGRMTPMMMSASTSGVQQTQLAALCAPPPRQHPMGVIMAGAVLSVVVGFVALFIAGVIGSVMKVPDKFFPLLFVIFFAAGGATMTWAVRRALKFHQYNREELPPLLAAWQRKWVCHKCHHQFDPEKPAA